jgi:predicted nucleotidyltransferase component of viral defense system
MTVSEVPPILFHEDTAYFGEALEFTSAVTGFPSRLIEKDYLCTVLLQYLAKIDAELVFKGGTCISKVHADFYRLSEDLDFAIPTPVNSSRGQRRLRAQDMKGAINQIAQRLPGFLLVDPFTGANNSSQYTAVLGYTSMLGRNDETIKIEVGLREPLLTPALHAKVRTILLDPVNEKPIVPILSVECLSWEETMAEKLRAALSRREVAIRDFYDIDHAVHSLGFSVLQPEFVELVRAKLTVPDNEPVDVSGGRLESLRLQVDSELKPVLRAQDFSEFDLDRAFKKVVEVAVALDR